MNKYDFEYKNDKYDIIAYTITNLDLVEYDFKNFFGEKDDEEFWIFNINGSLICFGNVGNYHLDGYSATVDTSYLHVITDFDYYKINLETLESEKHIELDSSPCDEIYKFNKGFVVIGEMDITYIESDNIKWEYSSGGVIDYAMVCGDNTIEVHEDEPYNKFTLNADGKIID